MKKIKKEIFNNFLNDDFLNELNIERSKKEVNTKFIENSWQYITKFVLNEEMKLTFLNKLSDILNTKNREEKFCNKEDIIYYNISYFLSHIIENMKIWFSYYYKIQKICSEINDSKKEDNGYIMIPDLIVLNHISNTAIINMFSTSDSIKFIVYFLNNFNIFIDEIPPYDSFWKENRKRIDKIQKNKDSFKIELNKLQIKLKLENIDNSELFNKLSLIYLDNNNEEIKWIKSERNLVTHNLPWLTKKDFFDINKNISNKTNLRIKIFILLFIDFILLFYILLFSLNLIED